MRKNVLLAAAVAAAVAAPLAEARITRNRSNPGNRLRRLLVARRRRYEKLTGVAYGEVDPHDRQNRVIVDIELAPRRRGNVEYAFITTS